ncbi:MAG TPA: cupin domain-containing protein [Baekduia sp.]
MKRVVTGWRQDGSPGVLIEGAPGLEVDFGQTSASEIWMSSSIPPDTRGRGDAVPADWQLEPPPGGTIFRLATHQPGEEVALHSTATVDYVVVLSGELTLLIGDREVELVAGDVVVQQGTPHGWANRSSEPCTVAAVLVSTRAVG